jgi:hypothetical protein
LPGLLQYSAAGRRDKLSDIRDQMHVFTLYDFIRKAEFDQTRSLKFMIKLTVTYCLNNGGIQCRIFNYSREERPVLLILEFFI